MSSPTAHEAFVGRTSELAALEKQHDSARSAFVPIYGRRRVGKTELLLRFTAGKSAVYFMASDKLATPQLADFVKAAAGWLNQPHLAPAAPSNWEDGGVLGPRSPNRRRGSPPRPLDGPGRMQVGDGTLASRT